MRSDDRENSDAETRFVGEESSDRGDVASNVGGERKSFDELQGCVVVIVTKVDAEANFSGEVPADGGE